MLMGQPLSKTCGAPLTGQRAVAKHIIASWSPRSEVMYAFSAHISYWPRHLPSSWKLNGWESIIHQWEVPKSQGQSWYQWDREREHIFGKKIQSTIPLNWGLLPSNNLSSKQIVVILLKHTSFKNFEPYCLLLVFSLLVVSSSELDCHLRVFRPSKFYSFRLCSYTYFLSLLGK